MARKPNKSAGSKRYPPTSSAKTVDKEESRASAEKPISLRPLEFEEAVKDLLKVRPYDRRRAESHKKPRRTD